MASREQAEAQVARVRELIAKHEVYGLNYIFIENLQTALDGDPNE